MKVTLHCVLLVLVSLGASGANLVYNSSFELGGMGHSAARQKLGYNDFAETGVWTTNAHSGSYGFAIVPESGNLYAPRYIRLPATTATNYTVSFWCNAEAPRNVVMMTVGTYGNIGSSTNTGFLPTVGSWTRFSRTIFVDPTNSTELYIGLAWNTTVNLWIDDIQVELGSTATDYAPKNSLEIGWIGDRLGHVIVGDMAKRAGLRLYSTAETNGTVKVEMQDWRNRTVVNLSSNLDIPAGLSTNWFALPASNGAFRAIARWNGGDNTPAETVFTVLPTPPGTNNLLGIHGTPNIGQVDYWRTNFGIVWNRSLSPAALFRWTTIEPTSNSFSWTTTDAAVNTLTNAIILGNICGADNFPAWALTNAYQPYLNSWSNYVYQVVNRYKDRISNWEDINEPYDVWAGHQAEYAQLLTITAAVVKEQQPTATFIALGGPRYPSWSDPVWTNLSAETKAQIDGVSTHLYPPSNTDYDNPVFDPGFLVWRTQSATYGKPVWNTETGGATRHQLRTIAYWTRPEQELWRGLWWDAIHRSLKQFIRSMGFGFARHFYYDARVAYAETDMGTSHFTLYNKDESIGTAAAALLWGSYFIGGTDGGLGTVAVGPVTNTACGGTALEGYCFGVGTNAVLVCWSEQKTNRTLHLSESAFAVYDVMGNLLQTNSADVVIDPQPIYLYSSTVATNTLSAAFIAATAITNADVVAPSIALDESPYGAVAAGSQIRCRWIACDDIAINTVTNTESLQTRYAWTNGTWSDWSGSVRTFGPLTLPNGTYSLLLQARDGASNVISYTGPSFTVGPPSIVRATTVNVGTLIVR